MPAEASPSSSKRKSEAKESEMLTLGWKPTPEGLRRLADTFEEVYRQTGREDLKERAEFVRKIADELEQTRKNRRRR